jgi:cytochrome o ubiquinol oxidase subunit 2
MNRKRIAVGILTAVAVLAAIIALVAYLHGASIPVLEPKGPVAAGEKSVILITLALCSIVVVPVFVLLFLFAFIYRADSEDSKDYHEPEWDHYNALFELLWWLVPSVIVFALGVLAVQSSHALDPYVPLQGANTPIEVEVVALDWKWLFIYPEQGIATVNMLEIPEGSPIHFELTADAPMNSFWVPALGGQIMVMPGMTTQLNLLAYGPGIYNGVSGNISGAGFAGMTFTVKSVSVSDFDAWVQSVQASSSPLTATTYQALAAPSQYNPAAYYSPVDANLYTDVTMKFMTPSSETAPSLINGTPMDMPMQ